MPPAAWSNPVLRIMGCLLLIALVNQPARALTEGSSPYLQTIGSPPLRFQDPPQAIEPVVNRPVASGPPFPVASNTENTKQTDPSQTNDTTLPEANAPVAPATPSTPAKTPPPIIPDETRPRVQAEDFLPFFTFPSGGNGTGDVTIVTPVNVQNTPPGRPIPSTATYRQQ